MVLLKQAVMDHSTEMDIKKLFSESENQLICKNNEQKYNEYELGFFNFYYH